MNPERSERAPGMADVIEASHAELLADLHTAIPATVVTVHTDANNNITSIDAKPAVRRTYLNEDQARVAASIPVITNIPVQFPGGGGARLTFPVAAGDFCMLIFSERSIDKWLTGNGAEVDPEIDHTHNLADAVALLGVRPFGAALSSAPSDHATLGVDGGVQMHMRSGRITVADIEGAEQFVALANKVNTEFRALQSAYSGHTHGNGGMTGTITLVSGATSGTCVLTAGSTGAGPSYSPNDVSATQLKAK